MKISNHWKLAGVVAPIIGGMVAVANFTNPPWDGSPAMDTARLWQVYSGVVERCGAVCEPPPSNPTPAMVRWRTVEYKAAVYDLLVNQWWWDESQPLSESNRLTPSNVLERAGLPQSWWTNTPYAGIGTATNGLAYFPQVLTQLVTTAAMAGASHCDGTNGLSACGWYTTACDLPVAESWFPTNTTVSAAEFPIGESRWYVDGNPNDLHQGLMFEMQYDMCVAGPVSTTEVEQCEAFPSGVITNGGPCESARTTLIWYQETNSISRCEPGWTCGAYPQVKYWANRASISWAPCGAASNVVNELWIHAGVGGCWSNGGTFVDRSGAGLSPGWNMVMSYSGAGSVCYSNLLGTNVPYFGETTTGAVSWAVDKAIVKRKWSFQYK